MLRIIVLLFVLSMPAYADSIHISGRTCLGCFGSQVLPLRTFESTLTVTVGTGSYWHPFFNTFVSGADKMEVVGINGVFDDAPMALIPGDLGDGRSWLFSNGNPGLLWFTAGGRDYRVFSEPSYVLFQGGVPLQLPMIWTVGPIVTTPEPSSLALLSAGLLTLLAGRFQRS